MIQAPPVTNHTPKKKSGARAPLFSLAAIPFTASALPPAPTRHGGGPTCGLPNAGQDVPDGATRQEPIRIERRPSDGSRQSTRTLGPAAGAGVPRSEPVALREPQPAQTKPQGTM